MVSTTILCKCCKATSQRENKEQKLMMRTVSIVKFCSKFQGSILGPLLFNIYVCDIFYDINDCHIAIYADDNTPYASISNLDALLSKLGESTNNQIQWFRNNHMKANADKNQLSVTANYEISANIDKFQI